MDCNSVHRPAAIRTRSSLVRGAVAAGLLVALANVAHVAPALADQVHRHTVHFEQGRSSSDVKGKIAGYDTAEYSLGARAGQTMTVKLKTQNTACYFNVFAPGVKPGAGTALFIGSTAGKEFSGALPSNGNYTVQVYMMRSAARRNETCQYDLNFAIRNQGAAAAPPMHKSHDALVPGTPYHATSIIPCTFKGNANVKECQAGVIRKPDVATVVVTFPDGFKRTLEFRKGKATSANAQVTQTRESDNTRVVVDGAETFVVPDALLYGG